MSTAVPRTVRFRRRQRRWIPPDVRHEQQVVADQLQAQRMERRRRESAAAVKRQVTVDEQIAGRALRKEYEASGEFDGAAQLVAYTAMGVRSLRRLAVDANIKGSSRMRKPQLIEELMRTMQQESA